MWRLVPHPSVLAGDPRRLDHPINHASETRCTIQLKWYGDGMLFAGLIPTFCRLFVPHVFTCTAPRSRLTVSPGQDSDRW